MTWEVHLSVSYLFAFSYCSWGSQSRNTEVVCHSLLQWTTFFQTFPPWRICLGWPQWHGLISLRETRLLSMWSDWLVFCDCSFSLSALWCRLSAPTVLLGFLLAWMWGISSRLLWQSIATVPYHVYIYIYIWRWYIYVWGWNIYVYVFFISSYWEPFSVDKNFGGYKI